MVSLPIRRFFATRFSRSAHAGAGAAGVWCHFAAVLPALVIALVVLLALPPALRAEERPGAAADLDRPNVVVIFADDLGYGDLASYNDQSKIPTPRLDRLAAEGVRFTNAYSGAAVCVPSRYCLLTGQYPFRGHPLKWTQQPTIPEGQWTLASLLQQRGYRTACIGKWHCGFEGGVSDPARLAGGPRDRGFDQFFGQHGSLDQPPYFFIRDRRAVEPPTLEIPESHEEGLSIIYQGRFWRAGKIAPNFKHEEVLETYAEEAIRFLRAQRGQTASTAKPFFLYLALTAPHGPWLPAERFRGKSKAGPLGDFVAHVDDVAGRVLDALAESGHARDTLVLFSSDNGPLWFEPDVHRYGHDSSGGLRGRKGDIWEGGIRMPLLARWPGRIPAGKSCAAIVGLVDVMATLADVVQQPLPPEAGRDSVSFLSVLRNPAAASPRSEILLQSLGPDDLAVRKGPWKLIPWQGSGGFLTKPKRRPPAPGEPPGQLYHLEHDAGETMNRYLEQPQLVQELTDLLNKLKGG